MILSIGLVQISKYSSEVSFVVDCFTMAPQWHRDGLGLCWNELNISIFCLSLSQIGKSVLLSLVLHRDMMIGNDYQRVTKIFNKICQKYILSIDLDQKIYCTTLNKAGLNMVQIWSKSKIWIWMFGQKWIMTGTH